MVLKKYLIFIDTLYRQIQRIFWNVRKQWNLEIKKKIDSRKLVKQWHFHQEILVISYSAVQFNYRSDIHSKDNVFQNPSNIFFTSWTISQNQKVSHNLKGHYNSIKSIIKQNIKFGSEQNNYNQSNNFTNFIIFKDCIILIKIITFGSFNILNYFVILMIFFIRSIIPIVIFRLIVILDNVNQLK